MAALTKERRAEIEASFAKQGLMHTFQAHIDALEHGKLEISMPYSDAVSQQHKFFHGGAIGALADTACGYAAISVIGDDEAALTAEYKINLLAPADGDRLVAIGSIIKSGRTLIVCQGDIYIEKDGKRKLCAFMLMTMCVVKNLGHK
ncbi:MAG: PaaI family thioesterase [Polynucleobacter sp.]